jgi:uncharacterized protein YecE (DUF72 family)
VQSLTTYLIGTGGWAYFKFPDKPSLKAYSEVFNFVEVNYTFYEYPDIRMVEQWRRMVPEGFTFAVRCHQDLTHRIGLKPVSEAYHVLNQMTTYCRILDAPFLVLETPSTYVINQKVIEDAKNFFSTINLKGVRLVWEIRATVTSEALKMMQDFNIAHCADLSREELGFRSDIAYTRLFGKGKHNIYQFTDEELVEIDQRISKSEAKVAATSYHGVRMNTDALRFAQYKKTGTFFPVTSFTGVDSVRGVLCEDASFPSSKEELIERQGWKVVDLTTDKRVHLSELLSKIPDKTYSNLSEVVEVLKGLVVGLLK